MGTEGRSAESVEIPLMRGGCLVSTLTGAFGQSLRETRLTALLGYLIALDSVPFLSLFGFEGIAQRISLETRHDEGRSDILVETTRGTGIIEAKVDASDPLKQSRRYPARWIALLTHRIPPKPAIRGIRYVSWEQLARLLAKLRRSRSARLRLLSSDLLTYLEQHRMTKNRDSVEIYAREINEPVTLTLFLKAQLYGCDYEAGSRLAEALYFAPHFGMRIARDYPGVAVGVSYVARIESVGHASTWKEFSALLLEQRGRVWWKQHEPILRDLHRKWSWNQKTHRSFLLLNTPRLVFNPPVRKVNLQKGTGWLSKRFFSFDEFFASWRT